MYYKYIAYNESGELVKGKLAADNDEAATELLSLAGYRAVSLKQHIPFFSLENLTAGLFPVKPEEIVIFYRQLSILLESGNDITASLEIQRNQADNRTLKKVLGEITSEIRKGSPLSSVTSKYPSIFAPMHSRLLNIGEQSGNLEVVLLQIADDIEKEISTAKETKNAMIYPVVTLVLTVIVVGVLLIFVLPSFSNLYTSMGTEMPQITQAMLSLSDFIKNNFLYIALIIVVITLVIVLYLKTQQGRYNWDRLQLKIPHIGRIRHLVELSRCCRSLSVLFGAGLPLTEAIPLVNQSCSNRAIAGGFSDIHEKMLKGEGLSNPMANNKLFLPLMVQMVRVGEEAGNLDRTLLTVSKSYTAEAEYKLKSAIALIQPGMTLFIGLIIALIALSMTSALYGIYETGL
ncbi:type II secretion system F family protein [Chloroflexota bacterium]